MNIPLIQTRLDTGAGIRTIASIVLIESSLKK